MSKPRAFTLRILGPDQLRWLERLEALYPTLARTKAVWLAIRNFPKVKAEADTWRRRAFEAESKLERVAGHWHRYKGEKAAIDDLLVDVDSGALLQDRYR